MVLQLSNSLRHLHNYVSKYVQIGQEENIAQLQDVLADQVLDFVDRWVIFL